MDTAIVTILDSFLANGILNESSMFLIIVGLIIFGYKYLLKPIKDKLEQIPTVQQILNLHKQDENEIDSSFELVSEKIDIVIKKLETIEDNSKGSKKDIRELKENVQSINKILNQFQGHFMYNRNGNSDFGNRELK